MLSGTLTSRTKQEPSAAAAGAASSALTREASPSTAKTNNGRRLTWSEPSSFLVELRFRHILDGSPDEPVEAEEIMLDGQDFYVPEPGFDRVLA